jgi:hypothetical protein
LVRRLIANELILSFVPDGEPRTWRSMTRMKTQLTRDRVRLQNQMACLLLRFGRELRYSPLCHTRRDNGEIGPQKQKTRIWHPKAGKLMTAA